MKIFSNLIFIALGLIISSALIQYLQTPANTILMIGVGLLILSIILSFISHNSATKPQTSQRKPQQTNKQTASPKILKPISSPTVTGTVKWYNKTKGFGFITQGNGEDIFVHQSALAFKGGTLKDGQAVTMQVVIDEKKRPQAENVQKA